MAKHKDIPNHTHKATLTIYSDSVDPDVWIQLEWDPQITGADIQQLGYLPAAFGFVQEHVVPMLDNAYSKTQDELANAEPASASVN